MRFAAAYRVTRGRQSQDSDTRTKRPSGLVSPTAHAVAGIGLLERVRTMSRYEHPVFGPDRIDAARRAYSGYRNAVAAYSAYGWHSGDDRTSVRLTERLSAAKATRDMYSEYGDSFLANSKHRPASGLA